MAAKILDALLKLLAVIPILDRWFRKTPTAKIEDGEKKIQDELDHFKETGRPKWD